MKSHSYTEAPFQGIKETAKITGFSQCYIRAGCKTGTIPCIRVGAAGVYRVNIPAFLEQLDAQSRTAAEERSAT